MTQRTFLILIAAAGLLALVGLAVTGCAPVHQQDAGWRGDDHYGTGQRGIRPDGGAGTVYQRDTPRAPQTPGGGD